MYKNDKEKQRDSLLGEAILELLDEKSFITSGLLLAKLKGFSCTDTGNLRKEAIDNAITMVMASESPYNRIYYMQ